MDTQNKDSFQPCLVLTSLQSRGVISIDGQPQHFRGEVFPHSSSSQAYATDSLPGPFTRFFIPLFTCHPPPNLYSD